MRQANRNAAALFRAFLAFAINLLILPLQAVAVYEIKTFRHCGHSAAIRKNFPSFHRFIQNACAF
jgi:hypothetical protein